MMFMEEAAQIAREIDHDAIDRLAARLSVLKGRCYVIGLGGSMANAIHMAADLGKLCNLDAQSFDNLSELTARANDEGWHTIFDGFLARATKDDALFVLSVGGGTSTVSLPITYAIDRFPGAIFGIVGPNGGHLALNADIVIKVPVTDQIRVTPHTESFQAVVWHCLVSHPLLQKRACKW